MILLVCIPSVSFLPLDALFEALRAKAWSAAQEVPSAPCVLGRVLLLCIVPFRLKDTQNTRSIGVFSRSVFDHKPISKSDWLSTFCHTWQQFAKETDFLLYEQHLSIISVLLSLGTAESGPCEA